MSYLKTLEAEYERHNERLEMLTVCMNEIAVGLAIGVESLGQYQLPPHKHHHRRYAKLILAYSNSIRALRRHIRDNHTYY